MRIVHDGNGESRDLATEVAVAETVGQKLKGLMFRSSVPQEYGLVFPFDTSTNRGVHMLFVRFPIDVIWTEKREVTAVEQLQPWTGYGRHRADRVIELPAGAANGVSTGDRVWLEE